MGLSSYLLQVLPVAGWAFTTTAAASPPSSNHLPNIKAAQENAFALFNSIHSAMRQWGSSVHHNGMSFYLAQAPEGSIFYHGDDTPNPPPSFEWLAFEFEHAAIFAESWEPKKSANQSPNLEKLRSTDTESIDNDILFWHRMSHHMTSRTPENDPVLGPSFPQKPLHTFADDKNGNKPKNPGQMPDLSRPWRGYMQIYRANRPLNLLYIDGESAAKCALGPMDSQDYILLGDEPDDDDERKHLWGEVRRGTDMCALAEDWAFAAGGKIDGFIRLEAGFEIIYCDFSPKGGLDLQSVQASHFSNETGVDEPSDGHAPGFTGRLMSYFEWLRAAAARFEGHPVGRLDVDWSSMVSAFSYPVNLTNADPARQDLPRIVNVTTQDRENIRARLHDVLVERGGRAGRDKGTVNWQGVVDKIVTRFSRRLWWMANATELTSWGMNAGVGTLIDPFTDYLDHRAQAEPLAIQRCARHYLGPPKTASHDDMLVRPETWTPEDEAIAAAVTVVSRTICTSLFAARGALRSNASDAAKQARNILRELVDQLKWSTWRECGTCGLDEVCSIPMFPSGSREDYFHPRCKNSTDLLNSRGYWGFSMF